jgi:hypothetical protein
MQHINARFNPHHKSPRDTSGVHHSMTTPLIKKPVQGAQLWLQFSTVGRCCWNFHMQCICCPQLHTWLWYALQ